MTLTAIVNMNGNRTRSVNEKVHETKRGQDRDNESEHRGKRARFHVTAPTTSALENCSMRVTSGKTHRCKLRSNSYSETAKC